MQKWDGVRWKSDGLPFLNKSIQTFVEIKRKQKTYYKTTPIVKKESHEIQDDREVNVTKITLQTTVGIETMRYCTPTKGIKNINRNLLN